MRKSKSYQLLSRVGTAMFLLVALGALPGCDEQSSEHKTDQSAIKSGVDLAADIPQSCGDCGLAIGDTVAVTDEFALREKPAKTANRIVNDKATQALGQTEYVGIDGSTTVKRLCVQSRWTHVRIETPKWLSQYDGWVPNTMLRAIPRRPDGSRVYTADDFIWEAGSGKHKKALVDVLNKIMQENDQCHDFGSKVVTKSPTHSSPGDPVWFTDCQTADHRYFNVWFRTADATNGRSMAAIRPISESAAIEACVDAAKSAATHPSTVTFSRVLDLTFDTIPDGRADLVSTFTAQNGFGAKLKYRIRCLFDAGDMIETDIAETDE